MNHRGPALVNVRISQDPPASRKSSAGTADRRITVIVYANTITDFAPKLGPEVPSYLPPYTSAVIPAKSGNPKPQGQNGCSGPRLRGGDDRLIRGQPVVLREGCRGPPADQPPMMPENIPASSPAPTPHLSARCSSPRAEKNHILEYGTIPFEEI
jgi:hypothetical protein